MGNSRQKSPLKSETLGPTRQANSNRRSLGSRSYVSVPTTLNDLERRDVSGKFSGGLSIRPSVTKLWDPTYTPIRFDSEPPYSVRCRGGGEGRGVFQYDSYFPAPLPNFWNTRYKTQQPNLAR